MLNKLLMDCTICLIILAILDDFIISVVNVLLRVAIATPCFLRKNRVQD